MVTFQKTLLALALGLSVAAAVTPAYAKVSFAAAVAPAYARGRARARYNGGGYPITAARAAALRECSAREAQYPEYLWGVTEIQVYRACMAEHGQPE